MSGTWYQVQWIVCVSLWIEKAVEVRYVHDKRACLPQPHAVTPGLLSVKCSYISFHTLMNASYF